jgi:predicted DNA repair protein MutK
MLGGAYLCFEATEKILEALAKMASKVDEAPPISQLALSSAQVEAQKVSGAIRTDLILSGEIMAIALATVADRPFAIQAGALVVVSFCLTVAVYGVVGLIVKMDDVGVHLAQRRSAFARSLGRALVKSMPHLMKGLTFIGTAAMLWVGGGIIVHGLEHFHLNTLPHFIEKLAQTAQHSPALGAVAGWLTFAASAAVVGFVVGGAIVAVVHLWPRRKHS